MGYKGRAALPSRFDAEYSYGGLISAGLTSVTNLMRPVEEMALRRHTDPVYEEYRAPQGEAKGCDRSRRLWCYWTVPPFKAISERREDWKCQEYYRCPGPQQFSTGDMDIPLTLQYELIPAGGTDPDPASAAELQ